MGGGFITDNRRLINVLQVINRQWCIMSARSEADVMNLSAPPYKVLEASCWSLRRPPVLLVQTWTIHRGKLQNLPGLLPVNDSGVNHGFRHSIIRSIVDIVVMGGVQVVGRHA